MNKLGEGWDVTNLYTIVPLRASTSEILTEQTIGRGLRLPYGKRTGVKAVDGLNIIAHDRFQEIINRANEPDSLIRRTIVIGTDILPDRQEVVTVIPLLAAPGSVSTGQGTLSFQTHEERVVAEITMELFSTLPYSPRLTDYLKPEFQEMLVHDAKAKYEVGQPVLEGLEPAIDYNAIVKRLTQHVVDHHISIPRVMVVPKEEVHAGFRDFELDVRSVAQQPVSKEVLLHELHSNERRTLSGIAEIDDEAIVENYIVRRLFDYDRVNPDRDGALLHKLAGQIVERLRSYLPNEEQVRNVVRFNQRRYADLIYLQMELLFWETVGSFDVHVGKNFQRLMPVNVTKIKDREPLPYRTNPPAGTPITGVVFTGFKRGIGSLVKFHSLPELQLVRILEDTSDLRAWLRPAPQQFDIYYRGGNRYQPDFVAEIPTAKLLIEVKDHNEVDDMTVQAKAAAARLWCERASIHCAENDVTPWRYVLIPDNEIRDNITLEHLLQ